MLGKSRMPQGKESEKGKKSMEDENQEGICVWRGWLDHACRLGKGLRLKRRGGRGVEQTLAAGATSRRAMLSFMSRAQSFFVVPGAGQIGSAAARTNSLISS